MEFTLPQTKVCSKCKVEKPSDAFPPDNRTKRKTQAQCRSCINAWMKEHYRKDVAWSMIRRAKSRAAREGFEFNITEDDIKPLPQVCPVFGDPLRISEIPQDPHAYSLDRINNEKGYVKGNIAVMSYRANRLKNDGTAEEHEIIAAWMRKQAANDNTAVTRAAEKVVVVV